MGSVVGAAFSRGLEIGAAGATVVFALLVGEPQLLQKVLPSGIGEPHFPQNIEFLICTLSVIYCFEVFIHISIKRKQSL